jgi:alkanesulfonate monooxygenase SsuD/methylene tetrahydromethanopterin reductase-like flavin-dependent oxidoreductase (luciferase family)
MKQSTHIMNVCADSEIKDMKSITSLAFEDFFATGALLGTPHKCAQLLERLLEIGVDEAACLIDFGMDVDSVMEGLHHLDALKNSFQRRLSPDYINHPAEYAPAR